MPNGDLSTSSTSTNQDSTPLPSQTPASLTPSASTQPTNVFTKLSAQKTADAFPSPTVPNVKVAVSQAAAPPIVTSTTPVAPPPTPAPAQQIPEPATPIKIELNISTAPTVSTNLQPKVEEAVIVPQTNTAQSTVSSSPTQQAIPNNQQTPSPVINNSNTQPQKKDSLLKKFFHWGIFISLIGLGVKGFFDCLYFITVEFQNFESGLEKELIETTLVSQLILKASLLVFATALSIFFGLQLTRKGGGKWLTIWSSMAVFAISFFILQYASTINVVDVFKSPSSNL